ncbi:MAG: pyruvate kinase [Candidatus Uhrbacteria bacterium]|nr:pyruvate kinase [Candidatus Uhrbacteria bacterium]
MEERRTKIICTIGPASSAVSVLFRMMKSGMDIARLNFSHGTYKDHKHLIQNIRSAANKSEKIVAILQDLQGPKIRVGDLPKAGVKLRAGQTIEFSTAIDEYKQGGAIPTTYKDVHKDVAKGDRILLDDGLLEAKVEKIKGRIIFAKVITGGVLKSHKGMNLPDSQISTPAFTEKDHEDLLFGLEQGVDWVALSFVMSAEIIYKVRKIIHAKCRALGSVQPKIIVKIERRSAIDNFDEILEATDAVMVARGDLGVELPFEEVPIIQKELVERCRQVGKPVVVATQMLDSMTHNPRATRAETSDVANAVIDHADAVMLSGETATGDYPDATVNTMATIVSQTEQSRFDDISFYQMHEITDLATSVAQSIHTMARNNQIDAVVTSSTYGELSKKINIFRPEVPIYLACPNKAVVRQNIIKSGVFPFTLTDEPGTFVHRAEGKLRRAKLIKTRHRVAYVTQAPSGEVQVIVR